MCVRESLASPDKVSTLEQEIDELDNRKDWINWITRYGVEIKDRFQNVTTGLLNGIIDEIVVHPTFEKNRDGVEKQFGHRLVVKFKQPIVDDRIEYGDKNKKSKGYTVVNGKKNLDVGSLEILKGGRGKKKQ